MLGFILRRIIDSIFLILLVSFITFAVMKMNFTIPALDFDLQMFGHKILAIHSSATQIQTGDPLADLKLNPAISKATIDAEAKRLGLDKSFGAQYLTWLTNILRGDFGYSQTNVRAVDLIQPALLNTLLLNITAVLITWLLAIPLGIMAAVKRNNFIDYSLRILTSIFMSVPSFVLAIFALLFALYTGLLPIGGLTSSFYDDLDVFGKFLDLLRHLILPVSIMVILSFAGLQRQMRANLLDVLRENYIKTARAKGLDEHTVIYKHAARNAINPLVTLLGYEFAGLLVGSALVEMVLAYPGLGYLTLESARKLDINVVMANLLLGSLMLILGNLLADLLLRQVDPRLQNVW
jgi:peptide/nickel transport system permease protein